MFDKAQFHANQAALAAVTVVGLLPLVLAGFSQWVSVGAMDGWLGLRVGVTYGAILLTFLGGARCGLAYARRARSDMPEEFAAGAATVLAAFLSLMLPALMCVCLQVAAFMLLGLWDLLGAQHGYVPNWYARLRNLVTPVAVLSLMSILTRLAL